MAYATNSVLLTDLYQLSMLNGYVQQGMHDEAVFEFFVRRLPEKRNFLLACGLELALDFLEGFGFTEAELEWMASTERFSPQFIDYLSTLSFTGDVYAAPEGTVFFADEPILRVVAPLPQAQIIESRLINILHVHTLIASKAARCVMVAPDKLLVDFGMRRAHGAEAAMAAARASYIAGFAGTATVLAEKEFGIPSFGTMAHSFVQAHDSETESFFDFARSQPNNTVLLIDTYDTEAGAHKVVELKPRLDELGIAIKGVRLDSGDLDALSRRVRRILDEGGCERTAIFCSGNLDEYSIHRLLSAGAPVDGFGIGTRLDISEDAPSLDCVYKLQAYAGRPRRKRSTGKATWPGSKQVYRYEASGGFFSHDVLTTADDTRDGEPLVEAVMKGGRRTAPSPSLERIRERTAEQLARLPEPLRSIDKAPAYEVNVSEQMKALAARVDREFF
ncbi:MAG: nicotinate phosphoribosyltransferase [Gammaproteobacteria bacterium]|nr:nicotinate phosphoribosyltransferase [Gammaproteobacteria bacterium]NIP90144.1 nicotinate phosphoribosyltransferase [Gammaproteobacteria bacterium]NIR24936.1 nicotinate phosphoribosyltransferase [Gammaproteobacteria bacterium]NIS06604.1 nicotinate phosphoribosyltransferase [Gammaproteobacteria bacterium]NIU40422.1 nicotinate phosphoribosyltransferase [Gammaproteobacteria bacterium]